MNTIDQSDFAFVTPDRETGLRLLPVARRIFSDAFAYSLDKDSCERFCRQTYALDGPMARDLADPTIRWRVATYEDSLSATPS